LQVVECRADQRVSWHWWQCEWRSADHVVLSDDFGGLALDAAAVSVLVQLHGGRSRPVAVDRLLNPVTEAGAAAAVRVVDRVHVQRRRSLSGDWTDAQTVESGAVACATGQRDGGLRPAYVTVRRVECQTSYLGVQVTRHRRNSYTHSHNT